MAEAVQAKAEGDRMFMIQPRMPVSLTVNISRTETRTETRQAVIGPQIRPPRVMTTSFGSYFKKSTTGTRPTAMTT